MNKLLFHIAVVYYFAICKFGTWFLLILVYRTYIVLDFFPPRWDPFDIKMCKIRSVSVSTHVFLVSKNFFQGRGEESVDKNVYITFFMENRIRENHHFWGQMVWLGEESDDKPACNSSVFLREWCAEYFLN